MTIQINNLKGTIAEMNHLFENAKSFSVRYFCPSNANPNNFDVTIRCNELCAAKIKSKRTLSSLIKIDNNPKH